MSNLANTNNISSAKELDCELTTTHIDDTDDLSYTTYGIIVRDEGGSPLVIYPDISTSREYVKQFIDIVKAHNDVAAIHIGDLLEDYLI